MIKSSVIINKQAVEKVFHLHRVGFSRGCLSVCEDGAVVPVQNICGERETLTLRHTLFIINKNDV